MIRVRVVTEVEFQTQQQFESFVAVEARRITGFDREIWEAQKTRQPIKFKSEDSRYGSITESTITYEEGKRNVANGTRPERRV